MATDYDAPRKTDDDVVEESIEELKARRNDAQSGAVDVDEADAAENMELPGADLSKEEVVGDPRPAAPGRRVHVRPLLPRASPQPTGGGGQRPAGLRRLRRLIGGTNSG